MEALASEFGFIPVHNPHPDWGISYTIRLGLEALEPCDGALFLVSDQPLLRPGGHILYEVGIGQADTVRAMMRAGEFEDVTVVPDTGGIDRVVYGTLAEII